MTENPADIFTKPLAWHVMKAFVEPLLTWKGDTADMPGSLNPEGSVAHPSCEQSRVASSHEIRDENRPDVHTGTVRASQGHETAELCILLNNQYTALCENDEE